MLFFIYVSIFLGLSALRFYSLRGGGVRQKKRTPQGYEYQVSTDKNGNITRFALDVPSGVNFVVHPERRRDRFFKAIGIARELQTGDAHFDRNFYIVTDDPDDLRSLFSTPAAMEAITRILTTYAKRIESHRGRMILTVQPKAYALFGEARVPEIMEMLKPLVQGMEKTLVPLGKRNISWLALVIMAVHSGLLMFAIPAWFIDLVDGYEVLDPYWGPAFYYGAAICLFWLAFLVGTFRDTAWMSWVGFDFLIIGVAGIMLSSGFFTESYNISADYAQPAMHDTVLLSKKCDLKCTSGSGKRRSTTTYDLTRDQCLAASRDQVMQEHKARYSRCRSSARFNFDLYFDNPVAGGKRTVNKVVKANEYDAASDGQRGVMPVHPGAVGYRWVNTKEITLD